MATSRINKLCPSCQTRVHLTDVQYKAFLRTLSLVVPCPSCGLAVSFSEMSEPDRPTAPVAPPAPLLANSAPAIPSVPAVAAPPFSPVAAPPFARMGSASGDKSSSISSADFARVPRASNPLLKPVAPKRTLNDRWEGLSGPGQGFVVLVLIAMLGGVIFGVVPSLGEKEPAPPRPKEEVEDKVVVPTKPAPPPKKPEVRKPPVATKPEAEMVVPRLVDDGGPELVVPREKGTE